MLQSRGPKDWVKYVVASSKVPSKPGLSSPKIFRAARFFEYRYKLWRRLAANGSDARGRRLSIGGRALGRSGRRAVGRGRWLAEMLRASSTASVVNCLVRFWKS